MEDITGYFRYWGKADKNGTYQPLVYHCLDVAAVGKLLADQLGIVKHIAKRLGCRDRTIAPFIPFLCAIHDVGKFSDGFQNQLPDLAFALRGVQLQSVYQEKHWSVSHCFFREYADQIFSGGKDEILDLLDSWFSASSGHHGRPPMSQMNAYFDKKKFPVDDALSFIKDVRELFEIYTDEWSLFKDKGEQLMKELSWLLAGLMVLADWIGSNMRWFPFQMEEKSLQEYWEKKALLQAKVAIKETGVLPIASGDALNVRKLFSYIQQATPLQTLAQKLPISNNANLLIIEEITGAGKTEAALVLANRLMAAGYADGVYFGLPTMATANAMHERIEQMYQKLFVGGSKPALILAHSASRQYLALESNDSEAADNDEAENAQADAHMWLYDNRKKALLAHFGVGTIDQALLAILPARHQSLRLLGLHRKVLVVDEVHAYDSYMNKLLCTLLKFHAAQGGSAILLSATLPMSVRKQFLSAFAEGSGMGFDASVQLSNEYPLVTSITGTDFAQNPVASSPQFHREINVIPVYHEDDIVSRIIAAVKTGKNICWIRNTVFDAQTAYDHLCKELGEEYLILFHARYALGNRLMIEKEVVERFGKQSDAERRRCRVVIATQVVEQSLDIDFDCMISDLAPIDLIIQRAGRLCRHARDGQGNRIDENDKRGTPELMLFMPPLGGEIKDDWYKSVFRKAAGVYSHHGQLWLTAQWFMNNKQFQMPRDARNMIESVYGENALDEIPEPLKRQEDRATSSDRAMAGMGQYASLNLESGYMPDVNWTDDEKAPTRLGDIRTTVRLARWDNDALVPFFNNCWMHSEVAVSRYWIIGEDETYRKAIGAAKDTMPDKGKFCVVVPLTEKDNVFCGAAVNPRSQKITVLYDKKRGLRTKEGEADESD